MMIAFAVAVCYGSDPAICAQLVRSRWKIMLRLRRLEKVVILLGSSYNYWFCRANLHNKLNRLLELCMLQQMQSEESGHLLNLSLTYRRRLQCNQVLYNLNHVLIRIETHDKNYDLYNSFECSRIFANKSKRQFELGPSGISRALHHPHHATSSKQITFILLSWLFHKVARSRGVVVFRQFITIPSSSSSSVSHVLSNWPWHRKTTKTHSWFSQRSLVNSKLIKSDSELIWDQIWLSFGAAWLCLFHCEL